MVNISYEPWRSKAHNPDLRWRMIHQRKVLNYSPRLVSNNLGVSVSTVRRIKRRFDTEGNMEKRRYPNRSGFGLITFTITILLFSLCLIKCGLIPWP